VSDSPRVALVYDVTCPNVPQARIAIYFALLGVGEQPTWTEWDRDADATPAPFRALASPTVIVDGNDICGSATPDADACRLYPDASGCLCGAPSAELIVKALKAGRISATR
jgi:hypothetical protein